MAKKDSQEFEDEFEDEFDEENDALIILPESTGTGDALVLLPEAESDDETLIFLSEPENAAGTQRTPAKLPDEKKARQDITQRTVKTGWKQRRTPPDWRKLSMSTLTSLPANIALIRGFMKAINWKEAQEEILDDLSNIIVIVGQAEHGEKHAVQSTKRGADLRSFAARWYNKKPDPHRFWPLYPGRYARSPAGRDGDRHTIRPAWWSL